MEHLFDMFPPTEHPLGKKMKSRGMSLAVVKRLCILMDISIEVSTQVGKGTLVRLNLPCRTL